jgi:hypothetical protein
MRRFVLSFTALSILLWALPLGAFIGASQEKTACGGKRGMHMCSMMKKNAQSPEKVSFSAASSVEKTSADAGSGTNMLLEGAGDLASAASRFEGVFKNIPISSFVFEPLGPPPRFR